MKKCPQCGAMVDDLAIFCDNCDAILDTKALLEEESPPSTKPATSKPPAKVQSPQNRPRTDLRSHTKSPPASGSGAQVANRQRSEPPPPFVPKSEAKGAQPVNIAEVQLRETFDEMLVTFKSMGPAQKAGLISALAAFIFSFFPWVSVPQEGSIPGLDVGGFYLIFIAIAYFTYILLDYSGNNYISRFEQHRIIILISLGFLGILLCTYRIIFPYDIEEETTILKNIGLKLDIHRKSGLFLSSLSSVGMFISPLLGGFRKRTEV